MYVIKDFAKAKDGRCYCIPFKISCGRMRSSCWRFAATTMGNWSCHWVRYRHGLKPLRQDPKLPPSWSEDASSTIWSYLSKRREAVTTMIQSSRRRGLENVHLHWFVGDTSTTIWSYQHDLEVIYLRSEAAEAISEAATTNDPRMLPRMI